MAVGIITGVVVAKSGVTLMARIRGNAGTLITQATLSSISYAVTNLTAAASVGTGTFTISATVFDDLQQNDPRWRRDSASSPGEDDAHGYNFRGTLAASLFVATGINAASVERQPDLYQADVVFTPTSGEPFRQVFQFRPEKVYG